LGHVPIKSARTKFLSLRPASAGYCCSIAALLIFLGSESLQNASADGETRTISFHHIHTKENLTVTYKRNGRYDEDGLKQINHLMRDWREDEPIKMNPHLIDLLWEVHREVGASEPIRVICGYRSPGTNDKLRRRSSGVARASQHMRGNAIDFSIPGVALEDVRAAGLRSQRGGVGYYPSSGFVHMDTGSVRHWPRMPEQQLERVIAKGPLNSRLASDNSSGRTVAVAQAAPSRKPAFLAKLFGGGEEDHAETVAATKPVAVAASEKPAAKPVAKPAEKLAAVPTPPARPAPVKSEGFQLASATTKPAAQPATFQAASATSKTVAVVVTPDTTEVAPAPAKPPVATPATYQVASATSQPVRPAQATSLVARANATANDIIAERGFWQGLPSAEPVEAPQTGAARTTAAPRRPAGTAVASAEPKTTASVASASLAPWPLAQKASEAPAPDASTRTNALAYAAQPTPIAHARPAPPMGSGNARPAAGQTVAVKRSDDRPSVEEPAPQQRNGVQVVRPGDRFNDPWMRAMIVSPSAQGFMRTTLYGVQDYRSLGPFFAKPASSVMMTFSQDPHLGMSTEKFAGSAVGFVSTVTFKARTAALR
jgi:uncharacterized protein YcbK (DUF882 family)